MADVFRVFAYDLLINMPICELPANSLNFDARLNDSGGISFDLDLLDPKAAAQVAPLLQYQGNPVALWVDRDGSLVWGGWSKTLFYQSSSHIASVTGKEFLDYFSQRFVARDYQPTDPAWADNGVDPALFAALAVNEAQSAALCGPGASINVSVYATHSSVPRVKPSYTAHQSTVGQVVSDAVTGAAVGLGGVDVTHRVTYGSRGGSPNCTLVLASPRAGRFYTDSGLAIDLGSAVDFTWPSDVQSGCTSVYVTGAGSGPAAPIAQVDAPGITVGGPGGLPRIDKAISHSTISNPIWLNQLAYGEAFDFGAPVTTPTVTLRTADPNCPLGSYAVGDDFRLFSEPSEFFPNGIDELWRLVAYSVQVADDDNSTVVLTFNLPPL